MIPTDMTALAARPSNYPPPVASMLGAVQELLFAGAALARVAHTPWLDHRLEGAGELAGVLFDSVDALLATVDPDCSLRVEAVQRGLVRLER